MDWRDSKPQTVKISSKHQKSGKVADNNIDECEFEPPCPYTLLQQYSALRGPYKDELMICFSLFKMDPKVTPQHMHNCLKKILIKAGFNPQFYSFHSLRIGRCGCHFWYMDIRWQFCAADYRIIANLDWKGSWEGFGHSNAIHELLLQHSSLHQSGLIWNRFCSG